MIKRVLIAAILSGLIFPEMGNAQQAIGNISQLFKAYRDNAYTEKVYVHTDKNDYLAGDVLWWKIYYVDGNFHQAANLSKLLYVELLDANNKPVLQAKTALSKSGGDGSFYIPVSIASGNYTLRAYTNWMKNEGPDYFYSRNITVVNPLKNMVRSKAVNQQNYRINFYPEGGNLVRAIESRVAFQVADQYGRGQDFTGAVISEQDTIVRFSPHRFGMGSFLFTPVAGKNYKAVIKLKDGLEIIRPLPAVSESGYVLKLSDNGLGQVKITAITNVGSARQLFLFGQSRQVIIADQQAPVTNGIASFLINGAQLKEGINQFTLFNENREPVAERLYFSYPKNSLSLSAKTDAANYGRRKKITVSIDSKTLNTAVAANLSMAVYRTDRLQDGEEQDIASYLWLGSDIKGKIESPNSYFTDSTEATKLAMDNLMMIHGWRRFTWETVLKGTKSPTHMPEFDGHILTAKMLDQTSGQPAAGANAFLSIPGGKPQFYPSVSDSSGILRFDVHDYYGMADLVLQAENNSFGSYKYEVANPFSELVQTDHQTMPFTLPETALNELNKASFAMQVQNIYRDDQINKFSLPAIDSLPFYGKHGNVYLLDKYVRFTTMEEVLREYVVEMGVRANRRLIMYDVNNKTVYTGEPLILLDGIPVTSEKILSFDPLLVKKLQVITNRYQIGEFLYEGLASFTTYTGNVEELQLKKNAVLVEYEGLQLNREFYSPVYETEPEKESRIPDYRELLLWAPYINTDSNGKASLVFYTSDLPGKYKLVLEGIDGKGHAGSISQTFEVTDTK